MPQNDRIGIDKFRAAFDAVKTDERAASDEGYDAVIASTIDIEFIRDIIEDEAIHHAALTLPLDKRLHKLSTSNRKLLEEKRLLGALVERLDGYIADPELLYREEILAAAHTGEALERALGTWQHVDPFAYPSVDYDPVKRKLLTMCHKQTSTEKGHVELVAELRPMLEADCSNVVAHGCNLFCAFREFGALDDKKRSVLLEGSARELLGWVTEESALGRIAVTSKRNRGLVGQERRSRLTPSAAAKEYDDALGDPDDDAAPAPAPAAPTPAEPTPLAAGRRAAPAEVEKMCAMETDDARRAFLTNKTCEERLFVMNEMSVEQRAALVTAAAKDAFDGAASLTDKLAALGAMSGVERQALVMSVSRRLRRALVRSMFLADLKKSIVKYKASLLEREEDDRTLLVNHGSGYTAHNRYSERCLGHALKRAAKNKKMRAGLNMSLALSRRPHIKLADHATSVLQNVPMLCIRARARFRRMHDVSAVQRMAISAAKRAKKDEATAASTQAAAARSASWASTVADRLKKRPKWNVVPRSFTVDDLEMQLAHHGLIKCPGDRIMINYDIATCRVTLAPTTAYGRLKKGHLAQIVRLLLPPLSLVLRRMPGGGGAAATPKRFVLSLNDGGAAVGVSTNSPAQPPVAPAPVAPTPVVPSCRLRRLSWSHRSRRSRQARLSHQSRPPRQLHRRRSPPRPRRRRSPPRRRLARRC